MKGKLKKGMAVFMASAMMMSVTACGGSANSSQPAGSSGSDVDESLTGELRITTQAWMMGKYNFDELKASFEKNHPGVTVVYNKVDNVDVTTDMLQWSQGKTNTDIAIGASREHAVQYAARDYVVEFDDEFFSDEYSKDKFFPAFLELGNVEGKQYVIPVTCEVMSIVANRELMKNAGLTNADGTITPPKDWNELYEYAKKATVVTDGKVTQTGLSIDWGSNFMTRSYLVALQGIKGNFYEADGKTLDFTSAESKGLLESWVKLVKDGYTPTDTFADMDAGRTNFKAGKVAMLMTAASRWIECQENVGEGNTTIIPVPGTDTNGSLVYIHGAVIPKASPKIELAKMFIKEELLKKEFHQEALNKYGKMSPILSHYENLNNEDWPVVVEATKTAATLPLYKDFTKLDTGIQTELQKGIKGDQTVEQTQQNLSKLIQSLDLTTGLKG